MDKLEDLVPMKPCIFIGNGPMFSISFTALVHPRGEKYV
jgi:hypothetical protein